MDEVKTCLIPHPETLLLLWGRSGQKKDQADDYYFALLALHGGITDVFWSLGCIWILLILLDSPVPARKELYIGRCISDRSAVSSTQTESSPWQLFQCKHMTYQHGWRMNNGFTGSFTNEIQLKLGPRVV